MTPDPFVAIPHFDYVLVFLAGALIGSLPGAVAIWIYRVLS